MGDEINLSERDEVHVLAIVRYLVKARSFIEHMSIEEFMADEKTQLATAMAVAQAGEHVKNCPSNFELWNRIPNGRQSQVCGIG